MLTERFRRNHGSVKAGWGTNIRIPGRIFAKTSSALPNRTLHYATVEIAFYKIRVGIEILYGF